MLGKITPLVLPSPFSGIKTLSHIANDLVKVFHDVLILRFSRASRFRIQKIADYSYEIDLNSV